MMNIKENIAPKGKFTDDDIRIIRKLIANGSSKYHLARFLAVSYKTIDNIAKVKTYKHVV